MTNSEIKCEQLRKLFADHYWDTFESDKKIILKHIDFVLSLWNTRTPESIDSIEKLTKLVSSIALECKKLGLTQIETSNILKHTFGTPEPTKSENGLVRLSNKNWDVICQVLRNHHEQLANGDYLKCVNAIIETLGIPSITKERLLAILPEHCGCHRDYRVCVRHEGENITIDEMKQRIEELFNEKIN